MTPTPAPRDEREHEQFEAAYPSGVNFERNPHHPEFYFHLPAREKWDAWMKRAALAEAELAEVLAENERLAKDFNAARNAHDSLLPLLHAAYLESSELRAELERVKKDSERYQWLCSKFEVTKLPCAIERILGGDVYVADGKASIDAAIDASRDGEGGGV